MEGGNGVALAYLDTAMKAPVDCSNHWTYMRNESTPRDQITLTSSETSIQIMKY